MLKGRNILLGVTGSIAAYKAAYLIRLLVKEGANVRVIMTSLAKAFIAPLTLATLAKNPIMVDFYNPENGDWNSHVSNGLWADLYLIAPATANTIGKMAHGIADNLLLTSYLSAKCPVVVAPAMDLDMFQHKSMQNNLNILKSYGDIIIEPASGELASGLEGKGRLAEPEEIVEVIKRLFKTSSALEGKKVLVTAGPTYEKIDPVRFIGNFSSGKMGFALATELANRGAEVTLITGPVSNLKLADTIKRIDVISAEEMYNAVFQHADKQDIIISCAAVADFTPEEISKSKIKRGEDELVIKLKPTKDIAAELGRRKKEGQLLIGFALENQDEKNNALLKLEKKNLDLIVLNSMNDAGAGFGGDTNKVTIIDKNQDCAEYPLKSKNQVASDIIDKIEALL